MSSSRERPTITALFADLRGSAVAALDTIVDRLGAVLEDEHAIVTRIDNHGLLAIFGVESDALPADQHVTLAARAALAVRAVVDRDASERRGHPDLELGLGLNTGGLAVTIASRLGASAGAGQILVGPATAALLSSEFDVRDRGTMELAGAGPTPVFELVR